MSRATRDDRSRVTIAALAVAVVLATGCTKSQPPASTAAPQATQAATKNGPTNAAPAGAPADERKAALAAARASEPSPEESEAFAATLSAAVREGNVPAINQLIDWNAVADRATSGIDVPDQFRANFTSGLLREAAMAGGVGDQIVKVVQSGGRYEWLRNRQVRGKLHALFRMSMPAAQGINYHEFPLVRREDGSVVADDVYVYLSGEYLSATYRRAFVAGAAHENRGLLDRLRGNESAYVKDLPKIEQFMGSQQRGDSAGAMAIYDTLSPEMKRAKSILLIRMLAAQRLGEAAYVDAMADFRENYPDDVALDFISIDFYLMQGQPAEALQCTDRLEKTVGGDPYLDLARANIYSAAQDLPAARKAAEAAVAAMPDNSDARFTVVALALAQQDHAEVARQLSILESDLGVPLADLTSVPEYAGFVASPEYDAWMAKRGNPVVEPPPSEE